MKRQRSLFPVCVTMVVVIGTTLATATGAGETVIICEDGHIAAYILASPVDGNAAVRSGGKTVAIGAEYEAFEKIAEVARLSKFQFFYVPLRIEAACEATIRNGRPIVLIDNIERVTSVSDRAIFDAIYADFGIEPVAL